MAETKKTTKRASKAPVKVAKPKAEKAVANGFAIIETGGKQYRVAMGEVIKIEKILGEYKEGDTLIFDKVMLVDDGKGATDIGTPFIDGAKVSATLLKIGRAPKIIVIKYKQKSRYFKKNGHRQPFFKVRIEKIS